MFHLSIVMDDLINPEWALLIDRVCDRFEAALKAGVPVRIEDHLEQVPTPAKPLLRTELYDLERAYSQCASLGAAGKFSASGKGLTA